MTYRYNLMTKDFYNIQEKMRRRWKKYCKRGWNCFNSSIILAYYYSFIYYKIVTVQTLCISLIETLTLWNSWHPLQWLAVNSPWQWNKPTKGGGRGGGTYGEVTLKSLNYDFLSWDSNNFKKSTYDKNSAHGVPNILHGLIEKTKSSKCKPPDCNPLLNAYTVS